MKAVYSFYSAPYGEDPIKNPGYWSRPGTEFLIWAWSVLQNRAWASQVEAGDRHVWCSALRGASDPL